VHKLHADLGAPPGFTDAIGWMEAVPADSAAGRSPHWAVTFSVADTDATVAAAEKGGAEVLVAPFDAGPVRSATLRDPQGATFGVRTFTPD
jgi:predicted enzyme related to lactoylglutathione lyase